MANYLVTGCSRGLGLELVKQLVAKPASEVKAVVATARGDASGALSELINGSSGRVHFVKLDITSKDSAKAAAAAVADSVGSIDVLVNNAGMINWMSGGIETMDDLSSMFDTNVSGVQIVTAAFVPLLQKGQQKKVINVSTSVGSIKMSPAYAIMPVPAYKVSKAALNMLTVQWALAYGKEHGVTFLSVSPGWLRTDLGGSSADLSVEEGGKAVLEVISAHGFESNGKFFNIKVPGWENNPGLNQYDGKELPW